MEVAPLDSRFTPLQLQVHACSSFAPHCATSRPALSPAHARA